MRLLAIANEFPLPLDRGGPVRLAGVARALAEEHEVHLLAVRRANTTAQLVAELRGTLGGPVEVFEQKGPSAGRGSAVGRWARALADGVPPWVRDQFSPELEDRAVELARDIDAVILLDNFAGIYAPRLAPFAPVVADMHNVTGWSAREVPVRTASDRLHRALTVHLARRFERRCVRAATTVVVTSPDEAVRLEQLYGHSASAVVPSAMDLPRETRPAGEMAVGWLGTLEYESNVQGLLSFARAAWTGLAAEGARLLVAGGGPPSSVSELGSLPGVEVLGYVDDLDAFLGRLDAAVVPLWQGAGVKLKTLAFMGAGVPVVGTPVALEGIDAEHGRHCLIADDPAGLADGLRELLSDSDRSRRMGAEARKLIAERYTWRGVGPRFREVVERAGRARA